MDRGKLEEHLAHCAKRWPATISTKFSSIFVRSSIMIDQQRAYLAAQRGARINRSLILVAQVSGMFIPHLHLASV
jgi:hypothetical protein